MGQMSSIHCSVGSSEDAKFVIFVFPTIEAPSERSLEANAAFSLSGP